MGRVDFKCKRNGSANVFCAVLPREGIYVNRVMERRTRSDFAKFLASLERRFADAEKIVLVMDNLNTHNRGFLVGACGEREGGRIWDRFEVHHTPKRGSWLNQAEVAVNMYAGQRLGRSRIPTVGALRKKTRFWSEAMNRRRARIEWGFTRKKVRERFGCAKSFRT